MAHFNQETICKLITDWQVKINVLYGVPLVITGSLGLGPCPGVFVLTTRCVCVFLFCFFFFFFLFLCLNGVLKIIIFCYFGFSLQCFSCVYSLRQGRNKDKVGWVGKQKGGAGGGKILRLKHLKNDELTKCLKMT